jgi:hypothetical protein
VFTGESSSAGAARGVLIIPFVLRLQKKECLYWFLLLSQRYFFSYAFTCYLSPGKATTFPEGGMEGRNDNNIGDVPSSSRNPPTVCPVWQETRGEDALHDAGTVPAGVLAGFSPRAAAAEDIMVASLKGKKCLDEFTN